MGMKQVQADAKKLTVENGFSIQLGMDTQPLRGKIPRCQKNVCLHRQGHCFIKGDNSRDSPNAIQES